MRYRSGASLFSTLREAPSTPYAQLQCRVSLHRYDARHLVAADVRIQIGAAMKRFKQARTYPAGFQPEHVEFCRQLLALMPNLVAQGFQLGVDEISCGQMADLARRLQACYLAGTFISEQLANSAMENTKLAIS